MIFPEKVLTGTRCRARLAGTDDEWAYGAVLVCSDNRKSVVLAFDEGIPVEHAGFFDGKQILLLMHDGVEYLALITAAPFDVEIE